jgi:hypothetical protein
LLGVNGVRNLRTKKICSIIIAVMNAIKSHHLYFKLKPMTPSTWLILFIERILKIKSCIKCGSWRMREGYYASGWNHYCNQASGHRGVICKDCLHVEFHESLEKRKADAPEWVEIKY